MNDKIKLLREEPGMLKLFQLFKEKYRSLGKIGGTVSLRTFSDEELYSIGGFLGERVDTLRIKEKLALATFENELGNTNYREYTLIPLMEKVLQEVISTKNQELEREMLREKEFIETLFHEMPEGAWWWRWLQEKQPDTRWIWSLYKQSPEELKEKLMMVYQAYRGLPKEGDYERLPLFAQRTTGNPHYFDVSQLGGKLLMNCLHVYLVQCGLRNGLLPKSTEEINELLSHFGIMRDDLWSFVTCQGLVATTKTGIHPVWQAALETRSVLNVPMRELTDINTILPACGKSVWVLENSSVSSTIMDFLPGAPLVCTHGQIRTAGWLLLDLLIDSGVTIYYSGDLDPDGLIIAERIKRRYGDKVILWRMDIQSYKKSLSEEIITAKLPKLNSVSSVDLLELKQLMLEKKLAGYQEGLMEELVNDIREILKN
jgi:uncharacterized protein (TIGR02679 family)